MGDWKWWARRGETRDDAGEILRVTIHSIYPDEIKKKKKKL